MKKVPSLVVALGVLFFSAAVIPVASAQSNSTPPHVVKVASGDYLPAAGYTWVTTDAKDLRVRWVPGSTSAQLPNIVAGQREGDWGPAPGFVWVNNIPNDLRVVPAPAPAAANQPTPQQVGNGVAKIMVAALSHAIMKELDKKQNPDFGDVIAYGLAKTARDSALQSALTDLFPRLTPRQSNGIQALVCNILDNQINMQQNGRQTLMNNLRAIDPDLGNAAVVSDFLYEVYLANQRR